jgi:hypothetical protein
MTLNSKYIIVKNKMKKILFMATIAIMLISCSQKTQERYKYVVSIKSDTHIYPVTITHHSGGNSVARGAGGAILGGGFDLLIGGSGKGGAIVGGLIGAATTDDPKSESYTEMRTDVIYTILFNDSTIEVRRNYCRYTIGDSVRVY